MALMKERCPDVPPKTFNCVPPSLGNSIIRAAWSDERVKSVIFESEEGWYVEVGAHEILRTSVPNVPSQRGSRPHLPPQLTLIHEDNVPYPEGFCSVKSVG